MPCRRLSARRVLCTLAGFTLVQVTLSTSLGQASVTSSGRAPSTGSGQVSPPISPSPLLDTNVDPNVEAEFNELLPRWDWSLTVLAGGGFNDNVALSSISPEASAFTRVGVEAVGLRLPMDGNQVTILFTGEDSRFFSSKTVDHEDLVVAQGEFRRFWPSDWETAFGLEGLYLDQVVDLSITETNRQPLPVRGTTFTARPATKRSLSEAIWLALELPATRQDYYSGSIDDYWQAGPKVAIGRIYGNSSEIAAIYEFTYRRYDTEPALAVQSDGTVVTPIPGRTRAADQHEVGVVWKHEWDAARHWRSTTRFSFRRNTDNGGGYYDYDRVQVAEQIRFRTKVWEAMAEARVGFYDFPVQTIDPSSSIRRQRTDLLVTLRVERKLGRHVRLFAQYEHEATDSNRPLDEYAANTVNGGVGWEF